jgi:hypothetical protein
LGVGVIVGEPTGISFKSWTGTGHAIDGAAAWSFSEDDEFQFHIDYLFHNYDFFHAEDLDGRLPVYFGVGGRTKFEENSMRRDNDDTILGVRLPLGVAYHPSGPRLDFFVEIVPTLDFAPDTDFELDAGIGMRFYFR